MLTRWNDFEFGNAVHPFSALTDLRRELNRVFSNIEEGYGSEGEPPRTAVAARLSWPRVSVYDGGSELRLRAEVPGLEHKHLDITIEQTSLTIRGERHVDAPEGYSVHRQERGASAAFARTFTLPVRVDTEKVSARLKNGVLEMTLPKVAEEQPRQVQVRAS